MKNLALLILVVLCSCDTSQRNERFVRKSVDDGNIKVTWYYLSFITDISPDFVEVVKGDSSKIIFEAKNVISNVEVADERIYLSLYKPDRGIIHTKNPELEFFGYHLVIDSLATMEEFYGRPDGKKD